MKKIEEKKTWIGFEIIYEMFDLKFNVRNMKFVEFSNLKLNMNSNLVRRTRHFNPKILFLIYPMWQNLWTCLECFDQATLKFTKFFIKNWTKPSKLQFFVHSL